MRSILLCLGLLLTAVVGCGGGGGGSTTPAPTPIVIATPTITAPQAAAYNATSVSASVAPQDGCSYQWSAAGAVIKTGQGTPSITFQPNSSDQNGTVVLGIVVSAPASTSKSAGATVQLGVMPLAPAFTDSSNLDVLNTVSLLPGGALAVMTQLQAPGVTFEWTATGGTVQSGQGSNSVVIVAGPTGTMSLFCKAVSPIGLFVQTDATVPVFDPAIVPPVLPIISGPTQALLAGSSGLVFSIPPQTGCSYKWEVVTGMVSLLDVGYRSISLTDPVSGQGTPQVVVNTPHIGGGGGSTVMFIRVVVSNGGGRVVASNQLSLL